MRIISVVNQKGGVGKTTTAVNLGAALAKSEKKTLIVELDPQSNSCTYLGFKKDKLLNLNSIYDCFIDELPLDKAIIETNYEYLYLVPANKKFTGIEHMLVNVTGRETLLKESIEACKDKLDFDYIIFDCPPALGIVSINALVVSDSIIIPVEGAFALEGVVDLDNTIKLVQKKFNPNLNIMGALLTKYTKTNLADSVFYELEKHFGDKVFKNVIRNTVRVGDSQAVGKPLIYFDSKSTASEDYIALAKEVIAYGD